MNTIGTRREKKTRSRSKGNPMPSTWAIRRNPTPLSNSTAGYLQEILPPQPAHLPRSRRKLTIGTFSHARTGRPQDGHREAGRTIDSSRGRRWMSTLKKLPRHAPTRKKTARKAFMPKTFPPRSFQICP